MTGQIIEESKYAIRIKSGGIPMTYYRSDIDKIEKDSDLKPKPKADPQLVGKKDMVLRLLEANGARENMIRIFSLIISQAPAESREELKEILKTDEIIERLVPIYDQYYTEDELKDLINFYKSPTGSKHLQLTPKIVDESMNAAVIYFQEKVADKVP